MKTWNITPEYHQMTLQSKDVAALFVSATSHWYDEPENAMYGKKDHIYNLVLNWLENDVEPENPSFIDLYTLNKFQKEWINVIVKAIPQKAKSLAEVKVGDVVFRIIGGSVKMPLKVTDITDQKIICSSWEFSRVTGGEIDEDLGWDGIRTGSILELS